MTATNELWLWQSEERHFAIPSTLRLPRGTQPLRRGLHEARVDLDALVPYEISPVLARQIVLLQVKAAQHEIRAWREGATALDPAQAARRVLEALVSAMPVGSLIDRQLLPEDLVDAIHRFAQAARRSPKPGCPRPRTPLARPVGCDPMLGARLELGVALTHAAPALVERLERCARSIEQSTYAVGSVASFRR